MLIILGSTDSNVSKIKMGNFQLIKLFLNHAFGVWNNFCHILCQFNGNKRSFISFLNLNFRIRKFLRLFVCFSSSLPELNQMNVKDLPVDFRACMCAPCGITFSFFDIFFDCYRNKFVLQTGSFIKSFLSLTSWILTF